MRSNFGSCLDNRSNEMCQMNTRISCITRRHSSLGGLLPSPSPKFAEDTSSSRDDDDVADGFGSSSDDEMTTSQ